MRTLVSTPVATGLLCVALAATLGACAGAPPPSQQMTVAEAAVQRANTVATAEYAAGELQLAKGKLTRAQEAVTRKEYVLAAQLAEEATLDAQVAELHAQAARSRKSAQETQDAARALSEEINRKTTR